jgi:hypothetical protein
VKRRDAAGDEMETKHTPTIHIDVDLDVDRIAASMKNREGVEFIKALDLAFGDWDVTLALADHFDKLRNEHALEQVEDAARAKGQTP